MQNNLKNCRLLRDMLRWLIMKKERKTKRQTIPNQRDDEEKIDGMIFMCNAKTTSDCFRYMVVALPQSKQETVVTIKPGLKLFLYDYYAKLLHGLKLFLYDYCAKLLHGINEASSAGGMKLEPTAFNGFFPAQVCFKLHSNYSPLSEEILRKAIVGESSDSNAKFNTELNSQQMKELINLFQSNVLSLIHNAHIVLTKTETAPYDPGAYIPYVFFLIQEKVL